MFLFDMGKCSMLTRRAAAIGGFSMTVSALAGCASNDGPVPDLSSAPGGPDPRVADENAVGARPLTKTLARPDYQALYGEYPGEKFPILAFDYTAVPQRYLRQTVVFPWAEPTGSIIVDPRGRHLYFVEEPGKATRYGVGVGREGFLWNGDAKVQFKRDWPDWVPPAEMIARDPDIRACAADPKARSARARCICSATNKTSATASTAPPSPRRSARACRRAACAWSTRTSRIFTRERRLARR